MTPDIVLAKLKTTRVIAGMRGDFPPDTALRVVEVLVQAGFNTFEMMMTSTEPIAAMQAVKREYGDEAAVGMGTVIDVESARRVLDAGADFVVSPAFQPDVVQTVLDAGRLMAPGVLTPSECIAAWEMGVPLLKLFPVGAIGVDYFKAIKGPLGHMRFQANGAINAENTREFLAAGAFSVGMVGWLTGDGHTDLDVIRNRAATLKNAVHTGLTGQPLPRTV